MSLAYDINAPKKATNISINSDLIQKAKAYKINLSKTLEDELAKQVKAKRSEQWLKENKDAIDAYNESIRKRGVFSNGFRQF